MSKLICNTAAEHFARRTNGAVVTPSKSATSLDKALLALAANDQASRTMLEVGNYTVEAVEILDVKIDARVSQMICLTLVNEAKEKAITTVGAMVKSQQKLDGKRTINIPAFHPEGSAIELGKKLAVVGAKFSVTTSNKEGSVSFFEREVDTNGNPAVWRAEDGVDANKIGKPRFKSAQIRPNSNFMEWNWA